MASEHTNTVFAKIRVMAYRLTDGRGSFHRADVTLACQQSSLNVDRFQVDTALAYLVKQGKLRKRGEGWYVWR